MLQSLTGTARAPAATCPWKQGDIWKIDLDPLAGRSRFDVLVSVTKDVKAAGKDCWQLALFSDSGLPNGTDIAIDAYIDKKTGWPIKIVERERGVEAKLILFGDRHVIAKPLEFFPVELFAVAEPGEFTAGVNKIVITNEKTSGKTKVGLAFFENNVEEWRIEQIWKDGALFWDSYERYVKGQLTLKATAKVFQLAARTDAEKSAEQKEADAAARAVAEKAKAKRDAHPLRQDKRLYALVEVLPKRPSVAHILRHLKEATGLEMEIDPALEKHVPDLGYISPGPEGYSPGN